MNRTGILATVAFVAMSFAAISPASAATAEYDTLRVSYGDINLDSKAGAQVMLHRIRGAARRVCGDRPGRMALQERLLIRRCSREAVEQGVSDVNRPLLTELFYRDHPSLVVAASN